MRTGRDDHSLRRLNKSLVIELTSVSPEDIKTQCTEVPFNDFFPFGFLWLPESESPPCRGADFLRFQKSGIQCQHSWSSKIIYYVLHMVDLPRGEGD